VVALPASLVISRTGTDLTIDPTTDIRLVTFGVSGRSWRRTAIEGRYQHGRALLGAVLDARSLTFVVRVKGSTWIAAQNNYAELETALSQFTYTVTATIDGRVDVYTCEPADITLAGGTLNKHQAMRHRQEYEVTIPVSPVIA
jgi:hypothetical protein